MPVKGYDLFYTEPDRYVEIVCRVCGTLCMVERGLIGPTGWAEALGGGSHRYDKFRCPHSSQPWHEQALRLVIEIGKSPSKRLIELMAKDLEEILQAHGL